MFARIILTPEFYQLDASRSFHGYLVGHARPYHCNYDSLLALQRIRDEELLPEDALFSKDDEAFIDLGAGLGLVQKHQIQTKANLNKMTEAKMDTFETSVFFGLQPPDKYTRTCRYSRLIIAPICKYKFNIIIFRSVRFIRRMSTTFVGRYNGQNVLG